MRIKGVYILSRKSIARMLTVMSAVLMMLCPTATAKDESFIGRIHNTSIALHNLDMKIAGRSTHTVVKPAKYHKCKLVYLEAKQYNKEHPPSKAECCQYPVPTANHQPDETLAIGNIGTGNIPTLATFGHVPQSALATKADLQKLADSITAAIRSAKREIIKSVHTERKSETDRRAPKGERGKQVAAVRKLVREARAAGKRMSILRACRKTWQNVKGGYPSVKALYVYCHRHENEF